MENFISLKEASKYCNYSQDYLKLRARQGKFKAVKIGRNWVTTREWTGEYGEYNERARDERKKNNFSIFRPPLLIIGLGLTVFLFLLFANLGYSQEYSQWLSLRAGDFLADAGSLIPSRVIEIK